jgi:hypothetical protein
MDTSKIITIVSGIVGSIAFLLLIREAMNEARGRSRAPVRIITLVPMRRPTIRIDNDPNNIKTLGVRKISSRRTRRSSHK